MSRGARSIEGHARRPRSIAVPIFALVLAAVLVATAVFFAVTFSGPPARPAPQTIDNVVRALETGALPRRQDTSRRLILAESRLAPEPRRGEQADPALAAVLAARLKIPAADIAADRDEVRAARSNDILGGFTIARRIGPVWRVLRTAPDPWLSEWRLVTLSAMIGVLLLLAGPAWGIARAISHPLRQLADSAAAARAGAPLGAMPQGGASEVRDLTHAVSAMHDRLSHHAEGRTAMLAAIAHDLGTPLSRLAFWIEQLPEAARLRATADIDEMRGMIGATLRFARDDSAERADLRIELGSLLDALVEDMNVAGAAVSIVPGGRVIVRGDPQALRRMAGNLIENAVRYGDSATVSWRIGAGCAEILVDDRGPGFDPAQAGRLFEPFVRGDPSRNRDTGGTGLGLAIVRSIAEAHRGSVRLEQGPDGGRVRVRLPIAG